MRADTFATTSRARQLEQFAWRNRSAPTDSEAWLWSALSAGKLGVPFRRQVPIGGRYIVDFLAPRLKLVVEVDGGYHAGRRRADARRDKKLRRLGYRAVRIDADLVMSALGEALELIQAGIQLCKEQQ